MGQRTTESIDRLYEVFAECPKPRNIDGCTCCIDEEEICTLLSKQLKNLTGPELSSYTSSLFHTVGGEADFKYFLPRIFELSAAGAFSWPDPEVVLGKLPYANWTNWSREQKDAVFAFLAAVLKDCIDDPASEIDTWLCAIGRCVDDISPYLDLIREEMASLIRLYEENNQQLAIGRLSNAFWDDVPDASRQVIEWFNSEEILKIINDNYQIET